MLGITNLSKTLEELEGECYDLRFSLGLGYLVRLEKGLEDGQPTCTFDIYKGRHRYKVHLSLDEDLENDDEGQFITLCDRVSPKLMKLAEACLQNARKEDREITEEYDKRFGKIEQILTYASFPTLFSFTGSFANAVSFGLIGAAHSYDLSKYGKRVIAWRLLRDCSGFMERQISSRSKEVPKNEDLERVADFYAKVNQEAGFGYNSMDRLLGRALLTYEFITRTDRFDVNEIYRIIQERGICG